MAPTQTRLATRRAKQRNPSIRRERMTDEKSDIPGHAVAFFLDIPENDSQAQLRLAEEQAATAFREEEDWLEQSEIDKDTARIFTQPALFASETGSNSDWREAIHIAERQAGEALEAERIWVQSDAFKKADSWRAEHFIQRTSSNQPSSEELSELSDAPEYQTYFDSEMAGTGGFQPFGQGTSAGQSSNLFGTANAQNSSPFQFSLTNPSNNTTGSSSAFGGAFGQSSSSAAQSSSAATAPPTTAPTGSLFGNTTTSGGGFLGASTGNTGGSAFGSNQASAASTQPGTPATSAPNTSLFGGTQQPPSFSFAPLGASNTPSGASTPQGQRQTTSFTTTPAGNPPSNLFGNNNAQSSTQASSAAAAPATTSTTGSSLFGGLGSNNNAAGSLFNRTPATPGAGGLFGSATSSAAAPAATSTSTAGMFSMNNASGAASTSQSSANAPAPATGGLFGNAGNTQSAATTAPAAGSLFANAPPAATSATPAGGLFGSARPAASSTPASGGLFANLGASSSAAPAAATATSAPAPSSGLFNTTSTTQPAATTSTAGAASASLFSSTANATANAATNPGSNNLFSGAASTSGPAPPAQSRLAQKTMDEILTGWSTSLSTHQKTFQTLAKQVSTWDRALVENSTRISHLYGRCFQAERDCSEVERQLSHVEHAQSELDAFLDRYEGEVDRLMDQAGLGNGGNGIGGVDAERERTYKMAENCSARLNDMGQSLTTMIEEINDASTKLSSAHSHGQAGGRSDDPLQQIVRVLNQHLAQLQSIDNGATALKGRVAAAHREARDLGQSQNLNGGNRALDDFGRSYLGRT